MKNATGVIDGGISHGNQLQYLTMRVDKQCINMCCMCRHVCCAHDDLHLQLTDDASAGYLPEDELAMLAYQHAAEVGLHDGSDNLQKLEQQPLLCGHMGFQQQLADLLAVRERSMTAKPLEEQLALISQVQQRLQLIGSGADRDSLQPEEWLQQQQAMMLDPADFRAGITTVQVVTSKDWTKIVAVNCNTPVTHRHSRTEFWDVP